MSTPTCDHPAEQRLHNRLRALADAWKKDERNCQTIGESYATAGLTDHLPQLAAQAFAFRRCIIDLEHALEATGQPEDE